MMNDELWNEENADLYEQNFMGAKSELELPLVAAASEMSDDIFLKHFNARHADGLNGMPPLEANACWPDQVATFRAFHRKIHDGTLSKYVITHNHNPGKPGNAWQDGE
jgi:hypothetical protein